MPVTVSGGWGTFSTVLEIVVTFALLAGCSTPLVGSRCQSGEQVATMDSLYFGTASANGAVGPDDWSRFVSDVVTPRFSRGLTSWAASGQWRNSAGRVQKESSYVLLVVHPDARDADAAIREVIDTYKTRFRQEAVLRVRSNACISF
jgi:hypothetical protein